MITIFSSCSAPPPVVSLGSHRYGCVFRPEHGLLLRKLPVRIKTLRIHSSNSSNGQSNEDKYKSSPSRFLNEEGVVEDMDGYLNYLSLEYDSVWDTKPAWCQPWTIALTGTSIIGASWLILHNVLATSVASTLIATWWYIFLYSYPKSYKEMIAERRKKVTSGIEDTFGLKNTS